MRWPGSSARVDSAAGGEDHLSTPDALRRRASVNQKKWMTQVRQRAEQAASKADKIARRGGLSAAFKVNLLSRRGNNIP